jgi:hypothetical protein
MLHTYAWSYTQLQMTQMFLVTYSVCSKITALCCCISPPLPLLGCTQHTENWAIDLSWDIIARFGCDTTYQLPREFFTDFVQVWG